ncbi:hypothetical protein GCM10007897_26250 [Sphingobium jiangsuense]|uniref:General secretion pathway protein L n=1 Tax=Sphingobium jiangsuense TaxID=870476 RepID=A0A7W6FR72_9SPHN|nr:type II secretion system protein GspL [Sphingobium jiangsuense]MBB3927705.1 general secretion pathway protein L [Sphingobium jiangsuense]GLT01234.1 hypothetical protein GCM10007897_26250 [Sphingobium jiangsuense]
MKGAEGLIVLLSPDNAGDPRWWRVAEGRIGSRTQGAVPAGTDGGGPVMLVLPPDVAVLRRVELDPAMPPAQARAVAIRKALEAGITDPAEMHAAALEPVEGGAPGVWHIAVIARADLAHCLGWAGDRGLDPDIVLPLGAILPEPEEGPEQGPEESYVRADLAGIAVARGRKGAGHADAPWMQALLSGVPVETLPPEEAEAALVAALARPPVNLRSGPFARRRRSGADAAWLRRMALLAGLLLLVSLSITVALIARNAWSTSRLDARTVALARPFAPAAGDAASAAAEIDRLVAERGGVHAFTGPLAGLMQAMRPVPGVSLATLSLNEDGLLHATLASARAEDINRVLLAVQGAGFRITATSSTDPGGRVIAEITVQP